MNDPSFFISRVNFDVPTTLRFFYWIFPPLELKFLGKFVSRMYSRLVHVPITWLENSLRFRMKIENSRENSSIPHSGKFHTENYIHFPRKFILENLGQQKSTLSEMANV